MDAFLEHFQTYHESQLTRLKESKGSLAVMHAATMFETRKLSPDHIREACWLELQKVSRIKYDEIPIAEQRGPRLGGLGWSVVHVKTHMDRFFSNLLEHHQSLMKEIIQAE